MRKRNLKTVYFKGHLGKHDIANICIIEVQEKEESKKGLITYLKIYRQKTFPT